MDSQHPTREEPDEPGRPSSDPFSPPPENAPFGPPPFIVPTLVTGPSAPSVWRAFFRLRGGSILYCLSALSILYGIAQIVAPVLATSELPAKTLPCVGALNVYELAMLGVLALIVVWRSVTDDAVFLVVLIGLFLAASGLTLATIANDKPWMAVGVGTTSCAIAAVKLWVLRRKIGVRFGPLMLVAVGVLLAWNFLMAPAMALVVKYTLETERFIRSVWQAGWLVMLAAGVVFVVHAARTASGEARRRASSTTYLRAPAMAWVFVLVLFAAACVQQYALTFIFDVDHAFGDFLPLIALGAVLAIELMRAFGKRFGATELVVAVLPLFVVFCTVAGGGFLQGPLGVGLLWYPPWLLGVTAAALAWLGIRNRSHELLGVATVYALAVVMTVGIAPATLPALNWQAFGIGSVLVLLACALIFRRAYPAMLAVVLLSLGVLQSHALKGMAAEHEVARLGIVALVAGLGTLAVYLIFPKKLSPWLAALGAVALAAGVIGCFGGPSRLDWPILSSLAVALVGAAVYARARDTVVAGIALVPLLRAFYVGTQPMKGWRYVVLSFALLAVGALASLRKGRHDHDAPSAGTANDSFAAQNDASQLP